MPINDNHVELQGATGQPRVEQGQAALVLVECLIHRLKERSILTARESLEVVIAAMEVQADIASEADGAAATMWRSHALLSSIAESLRSDV